MLRLDGQDPLEWVGIGLDVTYKPMEQVKGGGRGGSLKTRGDH
jgi:hypothetical protein